MVTFQDDDSSHSITHITRALKGIYMVIGCHDLASHQLFDSAMRKKMKCKGMTCNTMVIHNGIEACPKH